MKVSEIISKSWEPKEKIDTAKLAALLGINKGSVSNIFYTLQATSTQMAVISKYYRTKRAALKKLESQDAD